MAVAGPPLVGAGLYEEGPDLLPPPGPAPQLDGGWCVLPCGGCHLRYHQDCELSAACYVRPGRDCGEAQLYHGEPEEEPAQGDNNLPRWARQGLCWKWRVLGAWALALEDGEGAWGTLPPRAVEYSLIGSGFVRRIDVEGGVMGMVGEVMCEEGRLA